MEFGFRESIQLTRKNGLNPLIAEIKTFSPLHGDLLRGRDPIVVLKQYETAGASAISYITAREFGGNFETLKEICRFSSLPVLRKDFITNKIEIERSAEIGVSSLLLIARLLKGNLAEFSDLCIDHGIEPLVEVHSDQDLNYVDFKSQAARKTTFLINNRDISKLESDGSLEVTARLAPKIKGTKISGSGIKNVAELEFVLKYVDAALIGTAFMLAEKTVDFVRSFVIWRGR
jgi:indole-3-glycerol phosphate synthase